MIGALLKTSSAALLLSTNFALAKTSDIGEPTFNDDSVKNLVVPLDINGCTSDKLRVFGSFSTAIQTRSTDTKRHLDPTKDLWKKFDTSFEQFLSNKTLADLQDQEGFLQGEFFTTVIPNTGADLESKLQNIYPDALTIYPFKPDGIRVVSDPNCRVMENLNP